MVSIGFLSDCRIRQLKTSEGAGSRPKREAQEGRVGSAKAERSFQGEQKISDQLKTEFCRRLFWASI